MSARFAQHLWEVDQPLRRPACALTAEELAFAHGPRLVRFLADGVVKVDSVAEFGVDVAALSAQAADALAHHGYGNKGNGMWTSVKALPALEPLLRSESLAALLRGYLGGPVRYDGHYSFKLLNGIARLAENKASLYGQPEPPKRRIGPGWPDWPGAWSKQPSERQPAKGLSHLVCAACRHHQRAVQFGALAPRPLRPPDQNGHLDS